MADTTATAGVDAKDRVRASGKGSSLTVARFELLRHIRRRRFIVLLVLAGLMLALVFVVLQVFRSGTPSAYGYASSYGTWVAILAALAATFFGADAIVGEFEGRTGYLLFPQPVSRTSIFLGKALAAFVLMTLVMTAYYGIVAAATEVVEGTVPIEVAYSLLLAIVYSTSALGLAFFMSAALKGTTMSSIVTFALLFFVLNIVDFVFAVANVRPDGSLTFAGGTITNILSGPYPDAYPGDRVQPTPQGNVTVYSPAVPMSVVVMAIWAAVGFGLAWALFRRREMRG